MLFMCWLYVSEVLGVHLVQEGSGPCKIPNFSHLLWSTGHISILRDMYAFNIKRQTYILRHMLTCLDAHYVREKVQSKTMHKSIIFLKNLLSDNNTFDDSQQDKNK